MMWTVVVKFLSLVFNNLEKSLLIIAVCFAVGYSYLYNKEVQNREARELAQQGLPEGILSKYIQENRKLIKLVRDAEGKTRTEIIYVPDEGSVITITRERDVAIGKYEKLLEDIQKMDDVGEIEEAKKRLRELLSEVRKPPEVIVKDKGFTSRFGYGMLLGPGLGVKVDMGSDKDFDLPIMPVLDWKWGFWKRYSTIIQVNPKYIGPGITRHVDDFTPKSLHMTNLELGITGGFMFTGGKRLDIILRQNF